MAMRRRTVRLLWAALLSGGSVFLWARPLKAQKAFRNVARFQYRLKGKQAKCILCHKAHPGPSRKTLNIFGKTLQGVKTMKPVLGKNSSYRFGRQELLLVSKALKEIEGQDTDGDGATNKEELSLGFFPADAKSTPPKALLERYRKFLAAQKKKQPGPARR